MFSVSVLGRLCRYQYLPSLLSWLCLQNITTKNETVGHMCALSPLSSHKSNIKTSQWWDLPIFSSLIDLQLSDYTFCCVEQTIIMLCSVYCLVWGVCSVLWVQTVYGVLVTFQTPNTTHRPGLDLKKIFLSELPVQHQIKWGIISSVGLPSHGVLSVLSPQSQTTGFVSFYGF